MHTQWKRWRNRSFGLSKIRSSEYRRCHWYIQKVSNVPLPANTAHTNTMHKPNTFVSFTFCYMFLSYILTAIR